MPDNQPLERTAAAVYFTCGRASRVRRRGRSTASRYTTMKRSGYDDADPDPNPDWAMRDEKFATIEERDFVHHEFQPIPALVSRANRGHWRRYHGQAFDEAEWELVSEMWDHEHCEVCYEHIEPGMTYWASSRDTFLCDRCYDRYLRPPSVV